MVCVWIGVHSAEFAFFFFDMHISYGSVCQWVSCTMHGTHHLFDNPNFHWNGTDQWVPCTVHGTHKSLYLVTFSLKMGLTTLFTYLKIILLQCFRQNKRYPNTPLIHNWLSKGTILIPEPKGLKDLGPKSPI